MENDALMKKIAALEKEVKELKDKQKGNQNMFGRSYSLVGETSSDFLIKTKGQIKIQWGNKFIDLIKDGKVNVDAEFIFKGKPKTKDGIYVDGDTVILKFGDNEFSLCDPNETVYVSYLAEQETSPEMKHMAMTNIGFLYDSLSSIDESSLQNGIIYIESEKKLYTVVNGVLAEYTFEFPNPFPELFIIEKNDSDVGSLLIVGEGIENSVAFNNMWLYSDGDKSYLDFEKEFIIRCGTSEYVKMSRSMILFLKSVVGNEFKSPDANANYGFRLYMTGSESTLEVDNLIVRNSKTSSYNLYPDYWLYGNSIVSNAREAYSEDSDTSSGLIDITFSQAHSFKEDDTLLVFLKERVLDEGEEESTGSGKDTPEYVYDFNPYILIVSKVISAQLIYVENPDHALASDLLNSVVFLVRRETEHPLHIHKNNIDITEYELITEGDTKKLEEKEIFLRLGDLTELKKELNDNNEDTNPIVIGSGIYSDQGVFKLLAYSSDYELDEDDNSSRVPSTEWVKNLLDQHKTITVKDTKDNNLMTNTENVAVECFDNTEDVIVTVKNYDDEIKELLDAKIWGLGIKANNFNITGNMKDVGDILFSGTSRVVGSMSDSSKRPETIYTNGTLVVSKYNGSPWGVADNMKSIEAMTYVQPTHISINSIVDSKSNGHYFNNPRILWYIYHPTTIKREGHWWLGPTWANDYDTGEEGSHLNMSLYPSFDTTGMTNSEGLPTAEYFEQYKFVVGAKIQSHAFIKNNGTDKQFLMADGSVKELSELNSDVVGDNGLISEDDVDKKIDDAKKELQDLIDDIKDNIDDIEEDIEELNDKIDKYLPIGSIIMYSGTAAIPTGWAICDGENGTPNLVGKFIKAASTSGGTGGSNTVTIAADNLPAHKHLFNNFTIGTHMTTEIKAGEHEVDGETMTVGWIDHEFTKRADTAGYNGNTPFIRHLTYDNSTTNTAISIEPEYYALIFIMKIS